MKPKHLKRAAREAICLTGILASRMSRMPAGCQVPAEQIFAAAWPLACRLTRLERRAGRDKKAARAYRALRAEVAELLRTEPDSPVPLACLLRTVPLDAECWRTILAPGMSAEAMEAA